MHRVVAFTAVALAVFAAPAAHASLSALPELVVVRYANNTAHAANGCYDPVGSASCGSLPDVYQIGLYEVTNAQYAEMLNFVAQSDPNGLYNTSMATDARGGIVRGGSPGSYSYSVKVGYANIPVVFVSFYDALRFANWLHNGRPFGAQGPTTTENGAYTITPQGVSANSIDRNPGALWFLPSENEWFKAAYYDPIGGGYFFYPERNYTLPIHEPPPGASDSANYWAGTYALTGSSSFDNGFNYLTNVGAYTTAVSGLGTYDQGGNAMEWTEGRGATAGYRVKRGGSWYQGNSYMSTTVPIQTSPGEESYDLGFRIAAPEPGAVFAAGIALAALASTRRPARRGR